MDINVGALSGFPVKNALGLSQRVQTSMKKVNNQGKVAARKASGNPNSIRTQAPLSIPKNHRVRRYFGIRAPGTPY